MRCSNRGQIKNMNKFGLDNSSWDKKYYLCFVCARKRKENYKRHKHIQLKNPIVIEHQTPIQETKIVDATSSDTIPLVDSGSIDEKSINAQSIAEKKNWYKFRTKKDL